MTTSQKNKSAKYLREFLEIVPSDESTYVVAIASSKEKSGNNIVKISCEKCVPIEPYVYDSHTDSYCVECFEYLKLGFVPISFSCKMKKDLDWSIKVPMVENILVKYLTPTQKKELKEFKLKFSNENFNITYLQMIEA